MEAIVLAACLGSIDKKLQHSALTKMGGEGCSQIHVTGYLHSYK